jgi:hypothetical protein
MLEGGRRKQFTLQLDNFVKRRREGGKRDREIGKKREFGYTRISALHGQATKQARKANSASTAAAFQLL